jgi:hypothetical protein
VGEVGEEERDGTSAAAWREKCAPAAHILLQRGAANARWNGSTAVTGEAEGKCSAAAAVQCSCHWCVCDVCVYIYIYIYICVCVCVCVFVRVFVCPSVGWLVGCVCF